MIKFPKSIKVGGVTYNIILKDLNRDLTGVSGLCKSPRAMIIIDEKNSDQSLVEIFLHEIIHAIDFVYCGYILKELCVEKFTNALFQLIKNNDDFINGIIPESVMISGFKYDVVYPYDFDDIFEEDNISNLMTTCCDNNDCFILLGDKLLGYDINKDIQVINFIYSMILAVIYRHSITEEDFNYELYLTQFANGIYQVFKDINIKKFFNEIENVSKGVKDA